MQATPLFNLPSSGNWCYLGPSTQTLCADLIWRPVSDLAVGDELITFEGPLTAKAEAPKRHRRRMRVATVTSWAPVIFPCFRIGFTDGRQIVTCSESQWLTDPSSHWTYTRNLSPGRLIRDLGTPWPVDDSWETGWLGGAWDGEASMGSGWSINFAQNEGAVLDLAEELCKKRGYEVRRKSDKGKTVRRLLITGIYDSLRFLGECRPVRLLGKSRPWIETRTPARSRGTVRARRYNVAIEKIDFLGDVNVIAIQTSTQTILAEGLFSSLSFAPVKQ